MDSAGITAFSQKKCQIWILSLPRTVLRYFLNAAKYSVVFWKVATSCRCIWTRISSLLVWGRGLLHLALDQHVALRRGMLFSLNLLLLLARLYRGLRGVHCAGVIWQRWERDPGRKLLNSQGAQTCALSRAWRVLQRQVWSGKEGAQEFYRTESWSGWDEINLVFVRTWKERGWDRLTRPTTRKKIIYLASWDALHIMNFVVLYIAKMWMTRNGINWTEGQTSSILVVS